jgi:signal transduction histidine kinase
VNFAVAQPYATVVAFAALGANFLGTVLLLLINPHSRSVRWHAAFMFWIIAWLALQGWFTLGMGGASLFRTYLWVIHLMPAFFLAAALVETRQVRDRAAFAVIGLGVVTAPWLGPMQAPAMLWQALVWGSAALLHFRDRANRPRYSGCSTPVATAAAARGEIALKLALLVVVPVSVISIIFLGGGFVLYVMPLITILIQFLIFVGVVHHRFYDIEVRAARGGDLAAQAAEQERLVLLGELSATLAHEIRNPLTGMRSLAQRLAGSDIDEARRARYAGVILGEVERLERIVGNLLDIGRRSVVREGTPAATELAPLFEDLVLLVDGRARRAQVSLESDANSLVAAAPRDALAQALLNLMINAVAHTPPGGNVRLYARRSDGRRIEVSVSDDGPGVPPEEREQIFEPFHTRGLGAGLGLAVVRRLARELSWELGVADAPGGGASFHLRIPAVS